MRRVEVEVIREWMGNEVGRKMAVDERTAMYLINNEIVKLVNKSDVNNILKYQCEIIVDEWMGHPKGRILTLNKTDTDYLVGRGVVKQCGQEGKASSGSNLGAESHRKEEGDKNNADEQIAVKMFRRPPKDKMVKEANVEK